MAELTKLEKTMLDTISYYEGTIGRSQNGYNILFGGKKIMNGWTPDTTEIRHRCIKPQGTVSQQDIENAGYTVCEDQTWYSAGGNTTAAGRYQYLGYVWFDDTKRANLSGIEINAPMSKDNQDKVAAWSVKQKNVTENDLKKALNSLSDFKKVLNKLKKKWESIELSLAGSYGITVNDGFTFYKGAYDIYKNGGRSGAMNLNNSSETLIYINDLGETINKFGTSTTSNNTTDSDKFYVNIPGDGQANKIIFFWGGHETVISRKKQWDQIPTKVKEQYYIIMGNHSPCCSSGNDGLRNPFKRYFSSIGGDYSRIKAKVLLGYSAGGVNFFVEYSTSDYFAGAIEPSLNPSFFSGPGTLEENLSYGKNIAMIWGSEEMNDLSDPKWGTRYPVIQQKIIDDGGYSREFAGQDHLKAIEKWFKIYGKNLTDPKSEFQEEQERNQQNFVIPPSNCNHGSVPMGTNGDGKIGTSQVNYPWVWVGSSSVGVLNKINKFKDSSPIIYYNCEQKTLTWLKTQIESDTNIYDIGSVELSDMVMVGIGTNDGFPKNSSTQSQINSFVLTIKEKFPLLEKLRIIPGTYGWGNVIHKTRKEVWDYYDQFIDAKDSNGDYITDLNNDSSFCTIIYPTSVIGTPVVKARRQVDNYQNHRLYAKGDYNWLVVPDFTSFPLSQVLSSHFVKSSDAHNASGDYFQAIASIAFKHFS